MRLDHLLSNCREQKSESRGQRPKLWAESQDAKKNKKEQRKTRKRLKEIKQIKSSIVIGIQFAIHVRGVKQAEKKQCPTPR